MAINDLGDFIVAIPFRRSAIIREQFDLKGNRVKIYAPANCADESRVRKIEKYARGPIPYDEEIIKELRYFSK